MTNAPKPDLSDHEDEATPFDEVMRKLLAAKPAPRTHPSGDQPSEDQARSKKT